MFVVIAVGYLAIAESKQMKKKQSLGQNAANNVWFELFDFSKSELNKQRNAAVDCVDCTPTTR